MSAAPERPDLEDIRANLVRYVVHGHINRLRRVVDYALSLAAELAAALKVVEAARAWRQAEAGRAEHEATIALVEAIESWEAGP